jgi:hypothetical protein
VSAVAVAMLLLGLALGAGCMAAFEHLGRQRALARRSSVRTIAFPFTAGGLSEAALLAALRIASAEHATLMPVYLALVPRRLPADVPLQAECDDVALPMLEAVEQRAARAHVPVDARIERGRTVRHALRELMAHERFERMVVAAGRNGSGEGFAPEDVAWLLENAKVELVALRPENENHARAQQTLH